MQHISEKHSQPNQGAAVLQETNALTVELAREIDCNGPMPFERFMARALYDPLYGYYASGRLRIGRKGDFITSSSIGRVFGSLLAMQFEEVWNALGQPGELFLIEQGAGDGRLLVDVLVAARQQCTNFFDALQPLIIEPLESLRHIQQQTLESIGLTATWLASEADCPQIPRAIHYSNELLDAFPTHWLESDGSDWLEIHVAFNKQKKSFYPVAMPIVRMDLQDEIARRLPLRPAGFQAEFCEGTMQWARTLASRIESGLVLIMDYGLPRGELYALSRPQGTLRTYQKHRQGTNLLDNPGQLDITAHVDFSTCVEAFEPLSWQIAGFCDQHHFLISGATGLLKEWERSGNLSDVPSFKTLTHPAGMGTTFHALGFVRGVKHDGFFPSGFALTRQTDLLALRDCGS